MQNWTDSIIHWNQLPGTELKRLIATWGKTPEQIAKYDRKHGFVTVTKSITKAQSAKKPAIAVKRQKHTGADGEIKFVEHRNLYVGFMGGKVVVTKRTHEQCAEVLRKDYKLEV